MPAWKYCLIFLLGFGGDVVEVLEAMVKAFFDVDEAMEVVCEPYYPATKNRPV